MKKAAVLLAALFLAACGPASPSLPAGSTRLSSPTGPAALACRLPIVTPDGHGEFLNFPSATVSLDPNATGLQSYGGAYYDRAVPRWLPVNRSAVSPSGASYARLEPKNVGTPGRSRLHVVDVSSGSDRLYEVGLPENASAYVIVDFATEGIWLSYAGYEGPGGGLFLLDLATGALKDAGVPGISSPVAGGPGVFWFTDPGPNPQPTNMGFPIQAEMQRLTISDGKTEKWFNQPGSYLNVLGHDLAGHPIFIESPNQGGNELRMALSPSATKAMGVPQDDFQLIADSHGDWFGSQKGIYLYSDASGLQKVSDQPGYPANGCF